MSGDRVLFDSNIIIYISKKILPIDFVDQFDDIRISVITYMEILGFRFKNPNEEAFIKDVLDLFETVFINQEIAD